jgi:hypothetical protein
MKYMEKENYGPIIQKIDSTGNCGQIKFPAKGFPPVGGNLLNARVNSCHAFILSLLNC